MKILKAIDNLIVKLLPRYAIIAFFACWIINSFFYEFTQFLIRNSVHHNMTLAFDNGVPFVKEFIYIYFGSFLFWYVIYIVVARTDEETFFRLIVTDMICRFICFIAFVVFPTTNIRPEIVGKDISSQLVKFLYAVDRPSNLFPSIHCLLSWLCFISTRKLKSIRIIYRILIFVITILICISTQVLKQHYLVDFVAAVILSEVVYFALGFSKLVNKVRRFCDRITSKIWKSYKVN